VDPRRSRSVDPAIAADLAVIAEVRRSQVPTTTA